MTIHLTIVLFLPLAGALVGAFLPGARSHWGILAGSVGTALYAIVMAFDFDRGASGLQTGYLRSYAVLLVAGLAGLGLYFLITAS